MTSLPAPATTGTHTYPAARRAELTEWIHGEPVADPYRWLEDPDDPETSRWSAAQTELAARSLRGMPMHERFLQRVRAFSDVGFEGPPLWRGDRCFSVRSEPGADFPVLQVRSRRGPWRPLLDPKAIDPSGATTMDACRPSPDGRFIAYQLSTGGTEQSVLRVMDVDTGLDVDGPIDRTRYSPVAWLADGSGFYYVRRLAGGSSGSGDDGKFDRKVWFHRLGADAETDALVFGADHDRTAAFGVGVSACGRWLTVTSMIGTGPANDLWIARLDPSDPGHPQFTPVVTGVDARTTASVGADGLLYLLTSVDAPRGRLCVTDPQHPDPAGWRELVAEHDEASTVDYALLTGDGMPAPQLVVVRARHAVREVWLHDAATGEPVREITLPGAGAIGELITLPGGGPELWFGYTDHATPVTILRYDARTGETEVCASPPRAVPRAVAASQQVTYRSKDDTPVRMFILAPSTEPTRPRPTLVTGYGGFGLSMTPSFRPEALAWVEAGGVYAVPCLRGGAEEGRAWHQAGMREHKQNVFDDFHAAAEWLIEHGWTTPDQLAISGASNGGLLVGAAITQRPDLYRAALCAAPLLDMVRYEHSGLGPAWRTEYGSAEVAEQFRVLKQYSPYHRVVAGTPYPAVLFTVYEGDTRVDPLHVRKMAAALQWATSSPRPILVRSVVGVGHGARAANRSIELGAEGLAFLAHETALTAGPARAAGRAPAGGPSMPGHRLSGVSELRAIADQLRLRVLDLMMSDLERGWSVRELADRTGCAINRMHYHVALLAEQGLVSSDWVETHGRRERRYTAAHDQIWFARGPGNP